MLQLCIDLLQRQVIMRHLTLHRAKPPTRLYHRITLTDDTTLSFDKKNSTFRAFKKKLAICNPKYPIHIEMPDANSIDFTKFVDFLCSQSTAYHIIIEPLPEELMGRNTLLHDVYAHLARQQEQSPLLAHIEASTSHKSKKVRRAKQLLNRGAQIQIQTQQQYHQHQEQGVQAVQQQQKQQQQQQQVQQQMVQTRENQIQQQQQRLQLLNQENRAVDVAALGLLIHEGNLAELVTADFSLEDAKSLWFDLVGQYASKVEEPRNRITHVPEATLRLIAQHRDQFRDGIHFDDLPNGFGFTVRKKKKGGKSVHESIFYYDKKLVEQSDDNRHDSFLAARLIPEKPEQVLGTVGQFYPFLKEAPFNEEKYQTFIEEHQASFDTLISAQSEPKNRINALLSLMMMNDPSTLKKQLKALLGSPNQNTIDGLQSIFFNKGTEGITLLLDKLASLKQSGQYDNFKRLFMDNSSDWRDLVSTYSSRNNELSALEAIDYLNSMPPEQCNWWNSLSEQHLKANSGPFNLVDLVNAHRYFFEQIKALDPTLHLPLACPIQNVRNMKTTYARILYVLNKALDPQEQARYLTGLDFGMQGVICGASRLGPYHFVSQEMDLTPVVLTFDWEKLRPYAPKKPKRQLPIIKDLSDFQTSTELHFPTTPYRSFDWEPTIRGLGEADGQIVL